MAIKRVQSFTNRYLDEALERLKLPSDYALAAALGVTTQAIYKMRGGGAMGTTTAAKIAEILELEPLKVIADVELERATGPEERELWKRIREAAAIAGAAIAGALLYQVLGGGLNNNDLAVAFGVLASPIGDLTAIHIACLAGAAVLTAAAASVLLASGSARANPLAAAGSRCAWR